MARPHIEFVQEQDLLWEPARPAAGLAEFDWKPLSRDPESGAVTALVQLAAGWRSPAAAAFSAALELFVLEGRLQVALAGTPHTLAAGGYLRVGAETAIGPLAAEQPSRLLWMAAARLDPKPPRRAAAATATVADTNAIAWQTPWVPGPAPGLTLKLLWRDEATGAYSRLLAVAPGWREERLEHHDCSEEAYLLSGEMTMGALGTMRPGAYFWRPPGIRHGPMRSGAGAVLFIRTDGPLVNYYTSPDGTPLNY